MNEKFMQRAIELSQKNIEQGAGGPFGVVIVKNNNIIAEGTNLVTSTNDTTAHAEIVAIRNACKKIGSFHLDGCHMYSSCEPCPMCLAASYWAHIEIIYYGNTKEDAARINFDDSFIYQEIVKPYDERSINMINVMRKEAQPVFKAWANKTDKIAY